MANWIPGQGFALVQPSEPYDAAKIRKQMEELEIKLQAAEKLNGIRREQIA